MNEEKKTRKFFRTTVTTIVLSEDQPVHPDEALSNIAYEVEQGEWSGRTDITKVEELTGPEMAIAMQEQDSDPNFFHLSPDGEDLE